MWDRPSDEACKNAWDEFPKVKKRISEALSPALVRSIPCFSAYVTGLLGVDKEVAARSECRKLMRHFATKSDCIRFLQSLSIHT